MAGNSADVNLELVVRVKDLTQADLAKIGQVAAKAGAEASKAFDDANKAIGKVPDEARKAGAESAGAFDGVTKGLDEVTKASGETKATLAEIPAVSKQLGDGFDLPIQKSQKLGQSLDETSKKGNLLKSALGSLGKRAPAFIGVDLLTRVAGFNGLMDVYNKLLDEAADGIRELIGLGPRRKEQIKSEAEELDKLTKALKDVSAARSENTFTVENTRFGIGEEFNIDELTGKFREEALARIKANQEAQIYNKTVGETFDSLERLRVKLKDLKTQQDAYEEEQKRIAQATRDAEAADRAWKDELQKGKAYTTRIEATERLRQAHKQLADETLELADAFEKFADVQGKFDAGAAIKRRNEGAKQLIELLKPLGSFTNNLFKGASEKTKAEADAVIFLAQEVERLNEVEKANIFLEQERQRLIVKRTQEDFTFGLKAGVGDVLTDLKDLNRVLGQELAGGTFDAFRGLFRDVASGAKSASDAIKDLGKNFLGLISDIFAQIAAKQIVSGIFGGFGLDLNTLLGLEKGGVVGGNLLGSLPIKQYAHGGIADSPQLAVFGEGKAGQFGEAFVPLGGNRRIPVEFKGGGSGGDSFQITLNVGSLDPRTAAQVIMANMDTIADGVASSLQTGRKRGLVSAVRGA